MNEFFREGRYVFCGEAKPTCPYPKGYKSEGFLYISKIYSNNNNKCGNVLGYSSSYIEKRNYSGISTDNLIENNYLENKQTIKVGGKKSSLCGIYEINGNYLVKYLKGYSETIGKIVKIKTEYEKTTDGYNVKGYYLSNGKYKLYWLNTIKSVSCSETS